MDFKEFEEKAKENLAAVKRGYDIAPSGDIAPPPLTGSTVNQRPLVRRFVHETAEAMRRMNLSVPEIRLLYDSICSRLVHKNCQKCGRLKLEIEGRMSWTDGDMSKPKRFICKDC